MFMRIVFHDLNDFLQSPLDAITISVGFMVVVNALNIMDGMTMTLCVTSRAPLSGVAPELIAYNAALSVIEFISFARNGHETR